MGGIVLSPMEQVQQDVEVGLALLRRVTCKNAAIAGNMGETTLCAPLLGFPRAPVLGGIKASLRGEICGGQNHLYHPHHWYFSGVTVVINLDPQFDWIKRFQV